MSIEIRSGTVRIRYGNVTNISLKARVNTVLGFYCHLTTGIFEKSDDFDCGEIYVAIKPTEEVIKVLSICNGSFSIPLALTT